MSEIHPVSLEKTPQRELVIHWSDDVEQRLKFRLLRDSCPCANCMEKRTGKPQLAAGELKVLSPAEIAPIEILSMRPIGNYAYSIEFSDGHSSGIFSFDMLRSLSA